MMAGKGTTSAWKRVHADFNTLTSAPVGAIKLAAPGSLQERQLPPLTDGERVMLFDADGLEVEATIVHDSDGWWLATPDDATWHDGLPPEPPLPTTDTVSASVVAP